MNAPPLSSTELSRWTQPGSSRVPFWAYTDAQLYQRELEKSSMVRTGATWGWRPKSPMWATTG